MSLKQRIEKELKGISESEESEERTAFELWGDMGQPCPYPTFFDIIFELMNEAKVAIASTGKIIWIYDAFIEKDIREHPSLIQEWE
jgi:hypothetical protein